jgi:hypothetical protein
MNSKVSGSSESPDYDLLGILEAGGETKLNFTPNLTPITPLVYHTALKNTAPSLSHLETNVAPYMIASN